MCLSSGTCHSAHVQVCQDNFWELVSPALWGHQVCADQIHLLSQLTPPGPLRKKPLSVGGRSGLNCLSLFRAHHQVRVLLFPVLRAVP